MVIYLVNVFVDEFANKTSTAVAERAKDG